MQGHRAEHEETRAEDDQTRIDTDGEVNTRLAPTERTERSFFSLKPVTRSEEKQPEDEEKTRDNNSVQESLAGLDGDERTHDSAQRHENGYPTALSPVEETSAIEADGTHESERDD